MANRLLTEYVEIAKFKLKQGFTDEQFLEAEKTVREGMIKETKGFVGRELLKNDHHEWIIILRYDTKENMEALIATLKKELPPSFKPYASMIDFTTMRIEFFNKQI